MNERFKAHIEALPQSFEELLTFAPLTVEKTKREAPRLSGVYLLTENSEHLYVGRANDFRQRFQNHLGQPTQASFAFLLAREVTGKTKASYKKKGSRKELMLNPAFRNAFERAKVRIAKMHVRFVEENNPVRQHLLEAYVAVTLDTPYNSFKNS